MFESLYNNFIAEDRYRMILDGLQVTLLITADACFRMDETQLQQDFNEFLSEIRRDGTYQKIPERWTQADDPSALPTPQQRGNGRTIRVATFPSSRSWKTPGQIPSAVS